MFQIASNDCRPTVEEVNQPPIFTTFNSCILPDHIQTCVIKQGISSFLWPSLALLGDKNTMLDNKLKEKVSMFKIMFGVALKILVTIVFMAAIWQWYTGTTNNNLEKNQHVLINNQNNTILKNIGLLNQPAQRNETIKQKSERAVIQARKETESFDAIYKKPDECYNMKESTTRINCANNYMRARAAFDRANKD